MKIRAPKTERHEKPPFREDGGRGRARAIKSHGAFFVLKGARRMEDLTREIVRKYEDYWGRGIDELISHCDYLQSRVKHFQSRLRTKTSPRTGKSLSPSTIRQYQGELRYFEKYLKVARIVERALKREDGPKVISLMPYRKEREERAFLNRIEEEVYNLQNGIDTGYFDNDD